MVLVTQSRVIALAVKCFATAPNADGVGASGPDRDQIGWGGVGGEFKHLP